MAGRVVVLARPDRPGYGGARRCGTTSVAQRSPTPWAWRRASGSSTSWSPAGCIPAGHSQCVPHLQPPLSHCPGDRRRNGDDQPEKPAEAGPSEAGTAFLPLCVTAHDRAVLPGGRTPTVVGPPAGEPGHGRGRSGVPGPRPSRARRKGRPTGCERPGQAHRGCHTRWMLHATVWRRSVNTGAGKTPRHRRHLAVGRNARKRPAPASLDTRAGSTVTSRHPRGAGHGHRPVRWARRAEGRAQTQGPGCGRGSLGCDDQERAPCGAGRDLCGAGRPGRSAGP